jgi:uncharacterized RDD family membrane protein YckC
MPYGYCLSGTVGFSMIESKSIPVANTQKRIFAFVIDDLVISMFFMIIFYDQINQLFANVTEIDQSSLEQINMFIAENILIIFAIKLLYHTLLVWQNGMTIGKYIAKIKVIDLNSGYRPSFQQAFLRASVRLISEALFYVGFVMAFFSPLKQTMHDKFSNCVVIDV